MKKKRTIWTYETVILPLDVGKKACYLQNGVMKVTETVLRVLEQAEDHIKFETEMKRKVSIGTITASSLTNWQILPGRCMGNCRRSGVD